VILISSKRNDLTFGKRVFAGFGKGGGVAETEGTPITPGVDIFSRVVDDGISFDFMKEAYKVNPWVRAIVDKIISRANQVEIYPRSVDYGMEVPKAATKKQKREMSKVFELIAKPNDQFETFGVIRSKFMKDILLYDNAGMEIVKKSSDQYELLCEAPGSEIYPNKDKKGRFKSEVEAYIQIRNRKKIAAWTKSELMFFAKNRSSGTIRGVSPIESVALQISADLFADKYNIDFFSNNAMPNIAFLFENLGFGRGNSALTRAREWYIKEHQGKPHLPLFMGAEKGNVKIEQLQLSNKDMEFGQYQEFLLSKLMAVYGMQPIILGVINSTTGKLNSQEQVNQFKIDAVLPYLKMLVETMNLVLLWNENNFGYRDIYLTHDDLDLKDMSDTAEVYNTYLKNGVITINQVRQELKMSPVPWGDIPYIPVNIAPLGGQAPDRMSQNPAAADPKLEGDDGSSKSKNKKIEKEYKKHYSDEGYKQVAGLNFTSNSRIYKAIDKLLEAREKFYNRVQVEVLDVEFDNSLGKLGSKAKI